MTFASIPSGTSVFVDANSLVYHFSGKPQYGAACTQLVKRIELRDLAGFISTHVLTDVSHRLMTLEAMQVNRWPQTSIAARLRKQHAQIPKLSGYRAAVASIRPLGIQVLSITQPLVEMACVLTGQLELQ